MKARNVLLIIAGVLKTIVASLMLFFGLLSLVLSGLIRTMYEQSPDALHKSAKELAEADARYEYLLDYTDAQLVDFMMHVVMILCAVAIIWGLIILTIGIFNFLYVKYSEIFLDGKKWKIIMIVVTWVFSPIVVSTILTTIALALGRRKKINNNDKNTSPDIESFQV